MTAIDGFSGSILAPDSEEFAAAAGPIARPALIVRPLTTGDIAVALAHARAAGLAVAVRSGGHGAFASADDALLVDLRGISDVQVLDGQRVRVGSGAVWGDVATALQPHGLALTSGDTYTVGVGGLTLGAGIGWLVRQHGYALDNLLEAEVVLADGSVVTASATSEPELFWALRGGGGNFGIVSYFTFQAHPLAGIVSGTIAIDPGQVASALRGYRDAMRAAPELLNVTYLGMPAFGPEMPASSQLVVCYGGDDEAAAMAAIQPLLGLPGVTGHDIARKDYVDLLEPYEGGGPPPMRIVDNNGFADDFSDGLIDALVAADEGFGGSVLMIRYLRGAPNRVAVDATAFAHRSAEIFIISAVFLPLEAGDDEVAAMDAIWAVPGAHLTGLYGNFSMRTGPAILEAMYPPPTLARLREAKRRYDPDTVFARTHAITP